MSSTSSDNEKDNTKSKKVKYSDWMNASGSEKEETDSQQDQEDFGNMFDKKQYEGKKGHLLLQLQKSYKGDERFKMKSMDFDIDLTKKRNLPEGMLGALSKQEYNLLDDKQLKKKRKEKPREEKDYERFNEEEQQWDPQLDQIDKEKQKLLGILGTIVPQSEVFFKTSGSEDPRRKQLHIKRFDPTNPLTFSLLKQTETDTKTEKEKKLEEGKLEVIKAKSENMKYKKNYDNNEENNDEDEDANVKKVVDIKSSSWKNIISQRKGKDSHKEVKESEDEPENAVEQKQDFFLSFDTNPTVTQKQETIQTKKNKQKQEKLNKQQQNGNQENDNEDHEINSKKNKKDKKEKKNKKDKKQKEKQLKQKREKRDSDHEEGDDHDDENDSDSQIKKKERVPYEELPDKIKKRIEKRKLKREMLKQQRKIKIDFSRNEDELFEMYKKAYGDSMTDEKLHEYIKQQKLINEFKTKAKNRQKVK